jgi:S1/P1 Nuclease
LLAFTRPALAWNEHGHYVVCRLAWLQMTDAQRSAVTEILKKHPHYDAYLTKQKPDGFTVDEWAFMRAGPRADWIRGGQARAYGHSEWHYINYPVCFPGLGQSEDKHQPPPDQHNAVWAMNENMAKLRTGTDEEKAIALAAQTV